MKRLLTLFLTVIIAFVFTACSQQPDESLTKLSEKHAAVVGFELNHEPFSFKTENGAYNGFDLAIAQKVVEKLDVTLNLRVIEDEKPGEVLENGGVDFLCSNQSLLSGEDNGLQKSEVLFTNKIVVAVRTGAGVDSLNQLEGKKVAVVTGSTAMEALDGKRDFKSKITVIEKETATEVLGALENGEVDAIVADEMFVRNAVKNGASVLFLEETLAEKPYCFMFRKGDNALKERVDEILKGLAADGTLQDVAIEWFGVDVITLK